jgi:hypothetical protein
MDYSDGASNAIACQSREIVGIQFALAPLGPLMHGYMSAHSHTRCHSYRPSHGNFGRWPTPRLEEGERRTIVAAELHAQAGDVGLGQTVWCWYYRQDLECPLVQRSMCDRPHTSAAARGGAAR